MKSNLHFLEVRCFAEPIGEGAWQAFCVDLDLAAQAESFSSVRRKLDSMIDDYVTDAILGQDREYCEKLLSRKSPLSLRARYHAIVAVTKATHALRLAGDGITGAIAFVERPQARIPSGCN